MEKFFIRVVSRNFLPFRNGNSRSDAVLFAASRIEGDRLNARGRVRNLSSRYRERSFHHRVLPLAIPLAGVSIRIGVVRVVLGSTFQKEESDLSFSLVGPRHW